MNSDIRIAVSFKDHRKRKRLRMMLGDRATDYLLDLWITTALNHPDGFLKGMDALDIALDAGYDGTDPDSFVKALVACDLIEYSEEKSCYHVHDWEKHQGYAIHAEARSAKASKAANARWANKNAAAAKPPEGQQPSNKNATSMLVASKNDATSIASSMLEASENSATSIASSINHASSPKTQSAPEGQQPSNKNATSMLVASKNDATSMNFYAPRNAPSPTPTPTPNPNPEIQKDIPSSKTNLDTKIARAREPQGEDEDRDFKILRDFWNTNCRQEGLKTGLAELRALKKANIWPGIEIILEDIKEKIDNHVWNPKFAPSLRKYLGEEWFAVPAKAIVRSRDSPLAPPGSVTDHNLAVGKQVLEKMRGVQHG